MLKTKNWGVTQGEGAMALGWNFPEKACPALSPSFLESGLCPHILGQGLGTALRGPVRERHWGARW